MRSSVTVTGPPAAIWRRKIGTTEPDEPSTFPKRTVAYRVPAYLADAASTAHSAHAFEAPLTVAGRPPPRVDRGEHEGRHAQLAGDLRHQARRQGVVADRLDRIGLHHRDVLVGGSVEDDAGAVLGEHLAHPLLLLAVRQHRDRHPHVTLVLELAANLKQVVLGVIDEHELPRAHARNLT